jgi:adhesin/invasin
VKVTGVYEMNPRIRKILALVIPFLALACMQCGEKEGSLNPVIETEPPLYTIASLTVDKARIEPGEQSTITVVVEDRQGMPVAGYDVAFSVGSNFGTIDAGATTNGSGTAFVTYSAPAMTGVAAITVSGPDLLPRTTHIQVGEGILMVYPVSILADGLSTATVFLTLVDGEGLPVEGAKVTFSLTPERGMIYPASTETDSLGYAEATFFSEASVTDETVTVEASISYENTDYTELVNIYMRGVSMTADADPAEMPADGVSSSMVTVVLKETTSGQPIDGAEITFGSTLGAIGGSAVTDDEGYANVYLLSGTTPGVAAVRAEYGGFEAFTYVTLGTLQLTLKSYLPKMVADGGSSQMIEATLLTEDNTPVTGVEIDFKTSHGIIAKEGRTNSRGKAKALLTSADYVATATVTAGFSTSTKTVQVAFENPVVALKASPMTVTASPSKTSQVTAYVSFGDGSPVPDSTAVTFTTTEGTISSMRLTHSGLATAELRPSGVADDAVTIKARCGNTMGATQAMFIADSPAHVLVSATPATIPGGGGTFSTIVADIEDLYGNPVVDGTLVTFTVMSGNGIVTPSALTSSGVATAQFAPTGGGLATVRACCGTYCSDAGVVIMSEEAGTIVADPDTAWISVAGTGAGATANIVAYVYDSHAVPVDNGTEVTFEILHGPGGGEYLDTKSTGYGPVVRETAAGMASVGVNAGTKPGTILLSITAGDYAAATAKIAIAAGPPDSILIGFGEVAVNNDGTYTLGVSAIVRDKYNNPVENGTVVYFTLDRGDAGFINPETYTGADFPCVEQTAVPIKGVSRACLTYPSTSTFEQVEVTASTSSGLIGGEDVSSSLSYVLPLVDGEIAMQAIPSTLNGTTGDSCAIYVAIGDHYVRGLDNIPLQFSVDGDGSVWPATAVTNNTGLPLTTFTIQPGTAEGKTKVKAKIWMVDVEGEVEITITE